MSRCDKRLAGEEWGSIRANVWIRVAVRIAVPSPEDETVRTCRGRGFIYTRWAAIIPMALIDRHATIFERGHGAALTSLTRGRGHVLCFEVSTKGEGTTAQI